MTTHSFDCKCHFFLQEPETLMEWVEDCLRDHLKTTNTTNIEFSRAYAKAYAKAYNSNGDDATEGADEEIDQPSVNTVREWIGKLVDVNHDTRDLPLKTIKILGKLVPTMFPCVIRHSDERKKELEERLNEKYDFAVFKVADPVEFTSVTAKLLESEIRKLVSSDIGIPRLALSGGKFQVNVISELNPMSSNNRPCCVVSLNDVLGPSTPHYSANQLASALSQKISGCVYTAPQSESVISWPSYNDNLSSCGLFMVGCGGLNSFVAEYFHSIEKGLPDEFAGDFNYFPIGEDGKEIRSLRNDLQHYHTFGKPSFIAQKVKQNVPVILPVCGAPKRKVANAILKRKLANRLVVDVDLAENLLNTAC